jgi:hypothetical protein
MSVWESVRLSLRRPVTNTKKKREIQQQQKDEKKGSEYKMMYRFFY